VEQGLQVDEQLRSSSPGTEAVPLPEDGFIDFALAGATGGGEFRCADCGYGAVVQRVLPPCPMCGGTLWESRAALPPRLAD
jgi:hypothetical protein